MKECLRCGLCVEDLEPRCPDDGGDLDLTLAGPPVLESRYRLIRFLGRGGMGAVYEAEHLALRKRFAVKLLRQRELLDASFLTRFRVEAAALGRLDHLNVVRVSDFGIDARGGGTPYIVMELLVGGSLADLLQEKDRLAIDEALRLGGEIARGIDYIHASGVLHRDLKPANVFLATTADGVVAKILDFGLAHLEEVGPPDAVVPAHASVSARRPSQGEVTISEGATHGSIPGSSTAPTGKVDDLDDRTLVDDERTLLERPTTLPTVAAPRTRDPARVERPRRGTADRLTQAGEIMGTVGYMSPEVISGAGATPASDIYAVGVILYRAMVGQLPVNWSFADIAARRVPADALAPTPTLPPELDEPLLSSLSIDPARRPPSAGALIKKLRSAYRRVSARAWRRREIPRRVLLSAGLAVMTALAGLGLGAAPLVARLEQRMLDVRFLFSAPRVSTARLVLVSIDEATLRADSRPLVQMGDSIGHAIERLFSAGARGVALDLLVPESWGRSESFSRAVLQHSRSFVLTALSTSDGGVVGAENLSGLTAVALGDEGLRRVVGLANLDVEEDGRVRRAHLRFRDSGGKWLSSFAARGAEIARGAPLPTGRDERPLIDFSLDRRSWPKVSLQDLDRSLEREPDLVRGRLVVIGAEFAGSGDVSHRVPHPRDLSGQVSGMELQSIVIATLADGRRIGVLGRFATAATFGTLAFGMGIAILLVRSSGAASAGALALLCTAPILAITAFRWSLTVVPVVGPESAMLVGGVAAWILRARLPAHPEHSLEEEEDER